MSIQQSILKRLVELEKQTESNVIFTVEYENGERENLQWGEFMCYSVMKYHPQRKDEVLTITKVYCKPDAERYLQIPFAVLSSNKEALPKVIIE